MADHGYYRIYRDPSDRAWHWVLRSINNKDMARSCKGYVDRVSCKESIEIVKRYADSEVERD